MSIYWDVACLTCEKDSGLHINHGDKVCARIAAHGRQIGELQALVLALDWRALELRVFGEAGLIDVAWFAEHGTHVLAAYDEYGQFEGDCNEWGDERVCRRPEGHKGEHEFHPRREPMAATLARRKTQGR